MEQFIGTFHFVMQYGRTHYAVKIVRWTTIMDADVIFLIDEHGMMYNLRHIAEINRVEDK